MATGLRGLVGTAAVVLLAGCAAADLSGMQSRLDSLLTAPPPAAPGVGGTLSDSRPPDRPEQLAALSDRALAAGTGQGGNAATRVAMLRVAAIAGWQATAETAKDSGGGQQGGGQQGGGQQGGGQQGGGQQPDAALMERMRANVATASIEGDKACAALGAAAPPRDCAVLALAPALTDWDRQTVPWRGVTGRGPAEVEAMSAGGGAAAFEDVARKYTDARGSARVQNAAAIPSFKRWLGGLDTEVMRLACRRVSVFPNDMTAGEAFARARAEEARVGAALGMGCPQ